MRDPLAVYQRWHGGLDRASLETIARALQQRYELDECAALREWMSAGNRDADAHAILREYDERRSAALAAIKEITSTSTLENRPAK